MIEFLLLLAIVIYTLRSVIFIYGAYLERSKSLEFVDNNSIDFVSVVVPARNEENNIKECLESIADNNLDKSQYEIIAVNDRSTDRTGDIIENLKEKIPNLVPIHITEETSNPNLKGKPGALQKGIENAKGNIVIMTDADCTFKKNWIETIKKAFTDPKLSFLASFTSIKGKNFFENMQAIEWIMLHSMASAGLAFRQPLGCYGNNIAIRKKDFFEVGGYYKIRFSVTEDLALIRTLVENGKFVRYHPHPDSLVFTKPCKNFAELKSQHHRWATGGLELGWKAVLFVFTTAVFWLALLLSLLTLNFLWFFIIAGARLVWDSILMIPQLIRLNEQRLFKWLIPSILILMIWELIIPFLLLNKKVVWKGQVFEKK